MRDTDRNHIDGNIWGRLKNAVPSIFDLSLMAFLLVPLYFIGSYYKSVFFVFGALFLLITSFLFKEKVLYKSIPLFLVTLWAFLGVFIHSLLIYTDSLTYRYLNMYLMSEGFIYILSGVLIFILTVKYVKKVWVVWLAVLGSSFLWLEEMIVVHRITPILSVCLAAFLTLLVKKYYKLAAIIAVIVLVGMSFNIKFILHKFKVRPIVYSYMSEHIMEHPVIGHGFSKSLTQDNMVWVKSSNGVDYGWTYKQNDYLNIADYLGIPILAFIIFFVISSMYRIGASWYLIPFLSVVIACYFQMIMVIPERAGICLITMALAVRQTKRRLV